MNLRDGTVGPPAWRTLAWVVVYSVAMAYLEAAVVVYLRDLFYPRGFHFPLQVIDRGTLLVEIGREASTLAMLAAVAALAGRRFNERLAYFMLSFAIWDIFYYVWLKLAIGWPESLLTWDILFLIPLPWVGPVLAPVLVSISMLCGSAFILARLWSGGVFRPVLREWFFAVAGALLIILSFTIDLQAGLGRELPGPFRWDLLAAGLAIGFYALFRSLRRTRDESVRDA